MKITKKGRTGYLSYRYYTFLQDQS